MSTYLLMLQEPDRDTRTHVYTIYNETFNANKKAKWMWKMLANS